MEKYRKKHGLRQTFENVRLLLINYSNWDKLQQAKKKIENKDEIIIAATTT